MILLAWNIDGGTSHQIRVALQTASSFPVKYADAWGLLITRRYILGCMSSTPKIRLRLGGLPGFFSKAVLALLPRPLVT